MNELAEMVKSKGALTRPAKQNLIDALQNELGFALSSEYLEYLRDFGVISYGAHETFGLGVPESSHLHVLTVYGDLSGDDSYPKGSVPLLEVGDGRYYLYNNETGKVVLWATPNGGVVKEIGPNLQSFFIDYIFS